MYKSFRDEGLNVKYDWAEPGIPECSLSLSLSLCEIWLQHKKITVTVQSSTHKFHAFARQFEHTLVTDDWRLFANHEDVLALWK